MCIASNLIISPKKIDLTWHLGMGDTKHSRSSYLPIWLSSVYLRSYLSSIVRQSIFCLYLHICPSTYSFLPWSRKFCELRVVGARKSSQVPMTVSGAVGSSALGKGLWGCMVHLRSLLYFGIIAVIVSEVFLSLPFLGKMAWIHLSSRKLYSVS